MNKKNYFQKIEVLIKEENFIKDFSAKYLN